MTTETTLATATDTSPAEIARVVESLVVRGDISQLSTADRSQYYLRMCASLGLNPTTQPLAFLKLNGKDVLYVTRGATDQLAAMHRVNREIIDGPKVVDLGGTKAVYAVCRATLPNGRVETATAAIPATDIINSLMKVETKAKRRATLSILGLGVSLDESELDTIPAAVRGEPAPSPAVPDVDPDASRAYAAYVTAVEGAASCQAVAAAWMALLPALRLEGHDPAEWTTDALAIAVRRVADLGVVGAKGALREIATSTGDLPGLVDELLAQPAAAVPQWVASRADVLRTLAAPGPEIVRVVAARRYGGVATLDTASTAAAGRALAEAVAALSAREPGDDDGDEPPPSAPQPPPQGRRTRATGSVSDAAAPVDAPAAWLGDDAAAEAHAAGWSHARHVEASVRRHAPTVAGDAYDRLVRVATARMEALSQPDAYGTRPTAAGLHRTVSRWAAEGPVAARRAA